MAGFKKYEQYLKKRKAMSEGLNGQPSGDINGCTNNLENVNNLPENDLASTLENKKNENYILHEKSMKSPKLVVMLRGERSLLTVGDSRRVPLTFDCIQSLILQSLIGSKAPRYPAWCNLKRRDFISQVTVILVDGLGVSELAAVAEGQKGSLSNQADEPPLKKRKKDAEEEDASSDEEINLSEMIRKSLPNSSGLFPLQLEVESPSQHPNDPISELFASIPMSPNVVKNICKEYSSLYRASEWDILEKVDLKDVEITPVIEKLELVEKYHKDQMNRMDLLLSVQEMATFGYPLRLEGTKSHDDPEFVQLHQVYDKVTPNSPIFGIDCEMCMTNAGLELTRVSVVDEQLNILYTSFVKPKNLIVNYLTHWSGITPSHLLGIEISVSKVQKKLRKILPKDCILVGHSLDSDLHVLKLMHPYVIDTSRIYNLKGFKHAQSSLQLLTKLFLMKDIQNASSGHDPAEDAAASLELALLKLRNDVTFGDVMIGGFVPGSKCDQFRSKVTVMREKNLNRFSAVNMMSEFKSSVFKIIKLEHVEAEVFTTEKHSSDVFEDCGMSRRMTRITGYDDVNEVFEEESLTQTRFIVRHCRISAKKIKKTAKKLKLLDENIKKLHDSLPTKSLILTLFTTGSDSSVPLEERSKGILLVNLKGQERQQFYRNF